MRKAGSRYSSGEKLHEEMITTSDSPTTLECQKYFVIVPTLYGRQREEVVAAYAKHHSGKPVPKDFAYSSGDNTEWLSVDQLRTLIREHVDPNFSAGATPVLKVVGSKLRHAG